MASPYKKISGRSWVNVRDYWLEHLPEINFSASFPSPTLWQLPGFEQITHNAGDNEVVGYVPGVREALFRESTILIRKHSYCRRMSLLAIEKQRPTWASVLAYDSCFYAARSICQLLGIASTGRSSKAYIDVFVPNNSGTRKRPIETLDMRVHYLPERFTHSILWSLTERLLNSSFFDGESKEVVSRLARSDWGDFSTFRNSIHYDGAFWPNSDSIGQMDLVEDNCDHSFHRAFNDNCETTVPFANDYFEKLRDLRRLIRLMLQSISEFAPQIKAELDSIEK